MGAARQARGCRPAPTRSRSRPPIAPVTPGRWPTAPSRRNRPCHKAGPAGRTFPDGPGLRAVPLSRPTTASSPLNDWRLCGKSGELARRTRTMMGLRPPGLGPLVGHTTDRTCRIWIRAGDPGDHRADLDEDRRTVGVIGIVRDNGIGEAWYFRLNREFDRTGTFRLGFDVQLGFFPQDFADQGKAAPDSLPAGVASAPLTPDTEYVVRVGTLTLDDPTPNAARMPDWKLITMLPDIGAIKGDLLELDPEQSEARFRTFPASGPPATSLCFLLGSCRYPGLLWKIKEADRIFGPMRAHFESGNPFGEPARFTMMC